MIPTELFQMMEGVLLDLCGSYHPVITLGISLENAMMKILVARTLGASRPYFYLVSAIVGLVLLVMPRYGLAASSDSAFPDAGLTVPRFHFGTGRVAANRPEYLATLPAISGPVSPWQVTMWNLTEYLRPDQMTENDPRTLDTRFGNARYAFTSSRGDAHLWIYRDRGNASWIYELFERDGVLKGGGANLFLSAEALPPLPDFEHEITYSVNAKISKAFARYNSASAQATGAVLASAFSGFVLQFRDPTTGQIGTVFLQIPLTLSRGGTGYYRGGCKINGAVPSFTANQALPNDVVLPFRSDAGPLHHFEYQLNRYLCPLITQPILCERDTSYQQVLFPASAKNFGNWQLKSMYIGMETESEDLRPQAATHMLQGTIGVGLQISGLRVARQPKPSSFQSSCADAWPGIRNR